MIMTSLTIGQAAKQTGISHDTIRLYERYGLIDEPSRAANGYRQYPPSVVDRLAFILRTKQMSFTLKEIQELLVVHQTSQKSCGKIKRRTQEKLQQVADKINELKKLEFALKKLVQDCDKNHPDDLCPIFTLINKEVLK
ncbi:MAG: heavy metal-responsive transcriptional regulator [Legionellaceae bacterium]|nr:heavy metal-responsive transcriptional regulator [Legionellaceae bacterium]